MAIDPFNTAGTDVDCCYKEPQQSAVPLNKALQGIPKVKGSTYISGSTSTPVDYRSCLKVSPLPDREAGRPVPNVVRHCSNNSKSLRKPSYAAVLAARVSPQHLPLRPKVPPLSVDTPSAGAILNKPPLQEVGWTKVVHKKPPKKRPVMNVDARNSLAGARPSGQHVTPAYVSSFNQNKPKRIPPKPPSCPSQPRPQASAPPRSKASTCACSKRVPGESDEEFREFFKTRSDEIKRLWEIILRHVAGERHGMKVTDLVKALEGVGFSRTTSGDGSHCTFTPSEPKVGRPINFHMPHEPKIGCIELRNKARSIQKMYPEMISAMKEVLSGRQPASSRAK